MTLIVKSNTCSLSWRSQQLKGISQLTLRERPPPSPRPCLASVASSLKEAWSQDLKVRSLGDMFSFISAVKGLARCFSLCSCQQFWNQKRWTDMCYPAVSRTSITDLFSWLHSGRTTPSDASCANVRGQASRFQVSLLFLKFFVFGEMLQMAFSMCRWKQSWHFQEASWP